MDDEKFVIAHAQCACISDGVTLEEREKWENTQLLFEEFLQEKNVCLYADRRMGKSFEEGLRGGKLVKDLEIYWMNDKTRKKRYSTFRCFK